MMGKIKKVYDKRHIGETFSMKAPPLLAQQLRSFHFLVFQCG
jgi:hypothetical protein